ncbi:MAG: hypothetical protein J6M18_02720 [Actinomycetaceae bacterium]|nr:hypothetical protein [Actinomycetaceae bacterium]
MKSQEIQNTKNKNGVSAPLVFIGFTGVQWGDVTADDMPNVWEFSRSSALAHLVVKTSGERTCPLDAWNVIRTGLPVAVNNVGCVTQADFLESDNFLRVDDVLVQYFLDEKSVVASIGNGARIALSDVSGNMKTEHHDILTTPVQAFESLQEQSYDAIFIDAGNVGGSSDVLVEKISTFQATFMNPFNGIRTEKHVLKNFDERLGELIDVVKKQYPGARIMMASLGEADGVKGSRLQFFAYDDSSSHSESVLSSSTTRTWGLLSLGDLRTIIMKEAGVSSQGSILHLYSYESSHSAVKMQSDAQRAHLARYLTVPTYAFILLGIALMLVSYPLLKRAGKTYVSGHIGAIVSLLPIVSFIVFPLFNLYVSRITPQAILGTYLSFLFLVAAVMWALMYAVLKLATVRFSASFRALWALLFISLIYVIVLGGDIIFSRFTTFMSMQVSSPLGTIVQVGGRFYGFPNSSFALFCVAVVVSVLITGFLLRYSMGTSYEDGIDAAKSNLYVLFVILFVFVALIASMVDGLSVYGADFGGTPAIFAGVAVAFFYGLRSKKRVFRPGVMAGMCGVGVSFIYAFIDYVVNKQSATHLGGFIAKILDGTAGSVLIRKIDALTLGHPVILIIISGILFCGVVVYLMHVRSQHMREMHSGIMGRVHNVRRIHERHMRADVSHVVLSVFLSVSVALFFAFFLNDSGIILPLCGYILAVPLIFSYGIFSRSDNRYV